MIKVKKMVSKEVAIDSSEKSRKKKSDKEDIYAKSIGFEENESKVREPSKDSTLFHQTCDDIRKVIDQIVVLKKNKIEPGSSEFLEKKTDVSLSLVLLKKLNRIDKLRVRESRDALQKEKLKVDSNRLQLQNLLYEADHLNKEIQRCYQFKSQDEDIDLVSVEEFYENAPESISRLKKTKDDDHARRLARLEWELHQRKELSSLFNALLSEKDKVAHEITNKTERIDSLSPRLQLLLKATRPLQESLEIQMEKEWEVQRQAKLLPLPLYMIYVNISAYAKSCDKYLLIKITGDEDEAKQYYDLNSGPIIRDVTQDSDAEENEMDESEQKSHHHHRRLSKTTVLEQRKQTLCKPHPLSVIITFTDKVQKNNVINVKFNYIPALEFVTVQCTITTDKDDLHLTSGNILNPNNILNSLFTNDCDLMSPNPKTVYQLNNLNIEPKQFLLSLEEKVGKPYTWAQKACGIYNLSVDNKDASTEISLLEIIQKIRLRWETRNELSKQIRIFEENYHRTENISTTKQLHSIKISCNLLQWLSITYEDYLNETTNETENNFTEHDLFYKAVIMRGNAKIESYVVVPCNFPENLAWWTVCVNWKGKKCSNNNTIIRDMEYWINSVIKNKHCVSTLAEQMERLLYSIDIYLETEYSTEFIPDKNFLKNSRGRQRSRPFKFISNDFGMYFTQI